MPNAFLQDPDSQLSRLTSERNTALQALALLRLTAEQAQQYAQVCVYICRELQKGLSAWVVRWCLFCHCCRLDPFVRSCVSLSLRAPPSQSVGMAAEDGALLGERNALLMYASVTEQERQRLAKALGECNVSRPLCVCVCVCIC